MDAARKDDSLSMSLAAKLLKAKAALGLGDDDAPAREPMPKQHGGIDKSKKKVRLNARQKAKLSLVHI